MATRSPAASLTDIVEAIEHVQGVLRNVQLEAFEADWKTRWVVERGVEIISEASRRLPDEMKARHLEIPWSKVAGISNVLRHDYQAISAPIMWNLVRMICPRLIEFAAGNWPTGGIASSATSCYARRSPCR